MKEKREPAFLFLKSDITSLDTTSIYSVAPGITPDSDTLHIFDRLQREGLKLSWNKSPMGFEGERYCFGKALHIIQNCLKISQFLTFPIFSNTKSENL